MNPFTDQEASDLAWDANGGSDTGTYSAADIQEIGIGASQAILDLLKILAARIRARRQSTGG